MRTKTDAMAADMKATHGVTPSPYTRMAGRDMYAVLGVLNGQCHPRGKCPAYLARNSKAVRYVNTKLVWRNFAIHDDCELGYRFEYFVSRANLILCTRCEINWIHSEIKSIKRNYLTTSHGKPVDSSRNSRLSWHNKLVINLSADSQKVETTAQ